MDSYTKENPQAFDMYLFLRAWYFFLLDGPIRADRFADSHGSGDSHESPDSSQIESFRANFNLKRLFLRFRVI